MRIVLDGPDCYTGSQEIWWVTPHTRIRRCLTIFGHNISLKWFEILGSELQVGDFLNGGRIVRIEK